jgi:hypothetical protein
VTAAGISPGITLVHACDDNAGQREREENVIDAKQDELPQEI